MGICCAKPSTAEEAGNKKGKKGKKENPFAIDYGFNNSANANGSKLTVLKSPTGREIEARYLLGRELGRGEFGVTYLCTDKESGEELACKSISKKKLRTAIDIEDVRREVEIMRHLPQHPNIVTLKDTYEDDNAVHLVMELCEGGELFDRIVARGHYTERAAAAVTKTIVEVVQVRSGALIWFFPLGFAFLLLGLGFVFCPMKRRIDVRELKPGHDQKKLENSGFNGGLEIEFGYW